MRSEAAEARAFGAKAGAFAAINVVIAFAIGWFLTASAPGRLPNADSESILLALPEGEEFAAVILGNSRARILARSHAEVEGILGGKVFILAKGNGAGPAPMRLLLEAFHRRGNRSRALLYFLDPFVVYSPRWNEDHRFADTEPFDAGLFLGMASLGFTRQALFSYVQTKFNAPWIRVHGRASGYRGHGDTIARIDPAAVARRHAHLYPDGTPAGDLARNLAHLEALLSDAAGLGTAAYVLHPPTLSGAQPGMDSLQAALRRSRIPSLAVIVDFQAVFAEGRYFYDLDHMNARGIREFTKVCLLPLVRGAARTASSRAEP